ncbi:MAG: YlmC/YmxH family sporulation protein [Firmicutes bacterium]|nr:YlmC/YmxH family sporulation protein [Bacillota bacterium]MBO2520534.1 YlmC/YmxH family sporulation protein [Bacillota bacterium]
MVKTSDLRMLDVVNIGDGRRLGNVYDLDLDVETGEILAIILPGEGGFLGLGRRPDIEIPWNRIVRIGVDVILVDLPVQNIEPGSSSRHRHHF